MDALLQDLPLDPAALHGLSDKLLASHHRSNYVGAVKHLNAIRTELGGTTARRAPCCSMCAAPVCSRGPMP